MLRLAVVEQFENDFRARQTCKDVLELECEKKEKDKFIYSQATIEVKKRKETQTQIEKCMAN